jgi:drug/metabolite transporter (DMT)-like permease
MRAQTSTRAVALGLAAFTLWATSDALVKLGIDGGATPIAVQAITGLIGALVMTMKARCTLGWAGLRPQRVKPIVIRALIGVAMGYGFNTSYGHLPLTTAYALEFTAPFFIAVGGALFLGERLTLLCKLCIALGFAGGMVALDPRSLFAGGSTLGYAGALTGTVCYTTIQLMDRTLCRQETPEAIMFALSALNAIVGVACGFSVLAVLSWSTVLTVVAAALLCLSGGYLMLAALRRAPAGLIGALHYWQFIPGALFGYFIWHQLPTPTALMGSAIVIVAALLLARAHPEPTEWLDEHAER